MADFTREEKRECVAREYRLRKRAYPRWVKLGRMSQEDADRELALMQAVLDDYSEKDLF